MQEHFHGRPPNDGRTPDTEVSEGLQLASRVDSPFTIEELRVLKEQIRDATERFLDEVDQHRAKPQG